MEEPVDAISVGELTGHIKAVVEETFPMMWVSGEISDLVRARSGHIYLTLKDDVAQIRGIIWRSTAQQLKEELKDGQSVFCFGGLEVYAARGTYQLVIRKIQAQGIGALQLAFQKLQAKLHAEGLFAAERKKRLPSFPKHVAVVTSPSGAAIRDFLKAAGNRWQGTRITIVPAVVQGETASRSIVRAMRAARKLEPDVILLTRGGGSLEDLWCFNEEPVVRAVAESEVPTVSAVGHEVDVTLCDLAADVRALTPTDGATRILPDHELIDRSTAELRLRLKRAMQHAMQTRRARLESIAQRTVISRPHEMIHDRSRVLDGLDHRARVAIRGHVNGSRAKLAASAAALSALSPLDVLSRGYSVTIGPDGKAASDAERLNDGDVIRTRLQKGEVESIVRRK